MEAWEAAPPVSLPSCLGSGQWSIIFTILESSQDMQVKYWPRVGRREIVYPAKRLQEINTARERAYSSCVTSVCWFGDMMGPTLTRLFKPSADSRNSSFVNHVFIE